MAFQFDYVGIRFDNENKRFLFWGTIKSGSIHVGEAVIVPTKGDDTVGLVNTFWDSLYDWLGMPFYHTVTKDTASSPFCVCVCHWR
jgi:hypothetical protein